MVQTALKIEAYGATDIGLARSNNEDYFIVDHESGFFVLTDGMGGHNAGEIAAEEAAIVVSEKIKDVLDITPSSLIDELILHLKSCIVYANHHIYLRSKSHPSLKGMGTTLCCLLLYGTQLIFAHVGDSRIYRYRSKLTQLTRDHSLRTKMLALGKNHLFEKKPRWGRNVLTRSVGTSSKVEPEIGWEEALPEDVYFLCSDGLTDYVPEETISGILSQIQDVKVACETLIAIAKSHGGRDNITILMVKVVGC